MTNPASFEDAKLTTLAERVVSMELQEDRRVAVYLVPDREMERMRQKIKDNPHLTGPEIEKITTEERVDVLSFSAQTEEVFYIPEEEDMLGEVFVNRDVATTLKKQCELAIHGTLHLLGFSHSDKHDKIEMERKEQEFFNKLCPDLLQD